MHVIDMLDSRMFDVLIDDKPASPSDVFPQWQPYDRFAVLIYEPLGAIGATHLIQIACTQFYDVKPLRRTERKIYPEIYAIHVGRWWGSHVAYDFWPARREVRVSDDPRDILDAINDRGITRLALPDRSVRVIVHRRKEEDAALDRLATAILYNPSGRVEKSDISVAGNDRRTEINPQRVLRPAYLGQEIADQVATTGRPLKEGDPDYRNWLNAHENDITTLERNSAIARRLALIDAGLAKETYRYIACADALKRL